MTDKSSRRAFLQATAVAAVGGKTIVLDAGAAEAARVRSRPATASASA